MKSFSRVSSLVALMMSLAIIDMQLLCINGQDVETVDWSPSLGCIGRIERIVATWVALSESGNRVVIGDIVGAGRVDQPNRGIVEVFERVGEFWEKVGDSIIGSSSQKIGGVVDISGSGGRIVYRGTAVVEAFDWDGVEWKQVGQTITVNSIMASAVYGLAISNDGQHIVVGNEFPNGGSNVRVYELMGDTWVQVGEDIEAEASGDEFGTSVDISASGSRIVIGGPSNDGNGESSGHVQVYEWDHSSWVQVGADIDGEFEGDVSGASVSMSLDGNIVAIGAFLNQEKLGRGHVRVFKWNGLSWAQLGEDIDGGGRFGEQISLSGSGTRVAVGAPRDSESGVQAGKIQVWEWNGVEWMQVGPDILGEEDEGRLGAPVAISSNGDVVAGAAPRQSYVRVYFQAFNQEGAPDVTGFNCITLSSAPSVSNIPSSVPSSAPSMMPSSVPSAEKESCTFFFIICWILGLLSGGEFQ